MYHFWRLGLPENGCCERTNAANLTLIAFTGESAALGVIISLLSHQIIIICVPILFTRTARIESHTLLSREQIEPEKDGDDVYHGIEGLIFVIFVSCRLSTTKLIVGTCDPADFMWREAVTSEYFKRTRFTRCNCKVHIWPIIVKRSSSDICRI